MSASSVGGDDANGDDSVVVQVVMAAAQQDQVGHVGPAAVGPVLEVVGLQSGAGSAARCPAALIAQEQGPELGVGHDPA